MIRSLANNEMNDIDHALGHPIDPICETYRNFYFTSHDSDEAEFMDSSEWWRREPGPINSSVVGAVYRVTQAGREALAEYLNREGMLDGES